jgi:hypothetical protein
MAGRVASIEVGAWGGWICCTICARFFCGSENSSLEVLPHCVYRNNKGDDVKLGYSREVLGRTF